MPSPLARTAQGGDGPVFYHGTSHEFAPGELVTAGHPSNYEGGPHEPPGSWTEDHTYFTTEPDGAERHARNAASVKGGHPHVYEVEPTGPYEPTPADRASHPRPVYNYWSAHPLRVIRRHSAIIRQAAAEAPYVVYHGAHHDDVPSIMASGLRGEPGQPTVTTSRDGGVLHAQKRDWTAPKVLEIHVPRAEVSRYLDEPEQGVPIEGTIHALRQTLPPAFIRAVHEAGPARTAAQETARAGYELEGNCRRALTAAWTPQVGIFGPTTGLDRRLFNEQFRLRPEVRGAVMERLDRCIRTDSGLAGSDWQDWTRVYITGGSASEWAGSRPNEAAQDLDVIVAIDLHEAQRHNAFEALSAGEAASALNASFWKHFNADNWHAPFGGTWNLTAFCNQRAWNIEQIRPYAAWDLSHGTWAVQPPHLPEHTLKDFSPEVIAHARAVAAEARAVLRMAEPLRTREATALWNHIHEHRCQAFSPEGTGWDDVANVDVKWLSYAPGGLLGKIRELAMTKTSAYVPASASGYEASRPRRGFGKGRAHWSQPPEQRTGQPGEYMYRFQPAEFHEQTMREGIAPRQCAGHLPDDPDKTVYMTADDHVFHARPEDGHPGTPEWLQAHGDNEYHSHYKINVSGLPLVEDRTYTNPETGRKRSWMAVEHIAPERIQSHLPGSEHGVTYDLPGGGTSEWKPPMHREAVAEGYLRNPYHGTPEFGGRPDWSHTWFHGTKGEPDFGVRRKDSDEARRAALPPEQRKMNSGWTQPNQHLGVHFSPLHEVAHKFVGSVSSTPGSLVHARLRFTNPAVFDSEEHLNIAMTNWASKHYPHWHNEKLNSTMGWNYGDQEGTSRDFSQVPENPRERWHLSKKAQSLLQWHPHMPEILSGFRQHLAGQGHHGIIYGNSLEGPYETDAGRGGDASVKYFKKREGHPAGHPYSFSAIAHPDDVEVTHVEHVAPWREEPQPHQRTWEDVSDQDEGDEMRDKVLAWHREHGGKLPFKLAAVQNPPCYYCGEPLDDDDVRDQASAHEECQEMRWCEAHQDHHDDPAEAEDHNSTYTDWSEHLPFEHGIHRGLTVRLPEAAHQAVHDPSRPLAERARELGSHLHEEHGVHWTDHLPVAQAWGTGEGALFSGVDPKDPAHTHVVLHAASPAEEHIEDNPEELSQRNLWGFGHRRSEREIPLKAGAPVHLTGISWKRGGESEWNRHDFAGGISHIAAWDDDDEDPDRYVTCGQGHEHWGAAGAAGLLVRHQGEDGEHRYLLQHRSPYVQHGGTWSTPGGALQHGESPQEGAVREAREEGMHLPDGIRHHHTFSDDHGGWAYHTVVMDSPHRFDPAGGGESDWESSGHRWVTRGEMKDLPLHPGFAASWDKVRKSGAVQKTAGRDEQLAAMDPPTRASALAQEYVRLYHPKLTTPLQVRNGQSSVVLSSWLAQAGHPGAADAYIAEHRDPGAMHSNTGRGPDGEPAVILHPDRKDYGTLAHEAAHLIADHETGRQPGEPHGPDGAHDDRWAGHYAKLLENLSPGAGDDFLAQRGGQIRREAASGQDAASLGVLYHSTPFKHGFPYDDWIHLGTRPAALHRAAEIHPQNYGFPADHPTTLHTVRLRGRVYPHSLTNELADEVWGAGHADGLEEDGLPSGKGYHVFPYHDDAEGGDLSYLVHRSAIIPVRAETISRHGLAPKTSAAKDEEPTTYYRLLARRDAEMPMRREGALAGYQPPQMPPRQHAAHTTPDFTDYRRDILEVAKNPEPGTVVWRSEQRPKDEDPRPQSVGIHWTVNPDQVIHMPDTDTHHTVVYQGRLHDPESQVIPRSHPMWSGQHRSMDSEAEIRLRPGASVHVEGTWKPTGPDRAPEEGTRYFRHRERLTPMKPERMTEGGWGWHPAGIEVPVRHAGQGAADYSEFGIRREASAPSGISQRPRRTPGSAMVYLDVPEGTVQPHEGMETGHHIALAYLPRKIGDEDFERVKDRARQAAARHAPMKATISGGEIFPPGTPPDRRRAAVVPVHAPGIHELHAEFSDFDRAHYEAYTPHVTRAQLGGHQDDPPPHPEASFPVTHVHVRRGDEVHSFPLTGMQREAVSGYEGLTGKTAMIYLELPPGTVRLVPGGVEDHHVTLVYLGKNVSDRAFAEACRRTQEAAAACPPMDGVLRGIDIFPPSKSSDGKVPAFVPAYIGGIGRLRRMLEDLSASEHKDYRPHASLAYLEEGDSLPAPHPAVPVRFTRVHCKRGDEIVSYPLTGVINGA